MYNICAWRPEEELLYMTVSHHLGIETLTWVLWDISQHSWPLSTLVQWLLHFMNYWAVVFPYWNKKSGILQYLLIFLSLQFSLQILLIVLIFKLIQTIHKLITSLHLLLLCDLIRLMENIPKFFKNSWDLFFRFCIRKFVWWAQKAIKKGEDL